MLLAMIISGRDLNFVLQPAGHYPNYGDGRSLSAGNDSEGERTRGNLDCRLKWSSQFRLVSAFHRTLVWRYKELARICFGGKDGNEPLLTAEHATVWVSVVWVPPGRFGD